MLLALSLLAAQGTSSIDDGWRLAAPRDSAFTVMVPERPSMGRITTVVKDKVLYTNSLASSPEPRQQFAVYWTDHSTGELSSVRSPGGYQDAIRALVKSMDGAVLGDARDYIAAGYPGWRAQIRRSDGREVTVVLLVVGSRFYQLTAKGEPGRDGLARAQRFLESFALHPRRSV